MNLLILLLLSLSLLSLIRVKGFFINNINRQSRSTKSIFKVDLQNPKEDRPVFEYQEIKENKVLREKLEDDEDSILLYKDLSRFGFDIALAEEHINAGNFEQAERLANDAIELADHSRQVNNIYSAYATGILAEALYAEGKFQASADNYRRAFEIYKRHYRSETGPESVELLGALQLMSWILLSKKDYEEATIACQQALGISEKLLGPDNIDVASSMVNLATAYVNKGDIGMEPEVLLNKALTIYEQKEIDYVYNPEELKKLNFLKGSVEVSLGSLFYLRGNDTEALRHYQISNLMFDNGTYNYVEAVQSLKNSALILWRNNLNNEAEKLLAKALFKLETDEKYGINHLKTQKIRHLLHSLREGKEAPLK